ncbi:hypothetical protein UACE39S_05392 [Ureibacillus acetophenoni]
MTYIISFVVFIISLYLMKKYNVKGLMYLIILLLPFRFEILSISEIGIRITDLLSVIFIIIWITFLSLGKIPKGSLKLMSSILLFLFLAILSFLVNALIYSSIANIVDIARLILAVITGIAISTSIFDRHDLNIMLKTWAISATISSFISIFTFFSNGNGLSSLFSLSDLSTQEFYSIKFSNSLFFEDPNNLATYLLLSIFITIGLCFKKIIAYKYGYLLVVVQVLGLILTLSRSAYLAAIIAILVYLFVNKLNSIGWFFLKIGLISIITFFSITFIFSLNTDISAISRFGLWNVGINMTLSNPILGVGIGNSSILFTQYVSSSLVIFNPHFHNLYLTISSEIGFVGLISFLLIFTKHLYSWIASNDQLYKFMCLALIAYLVQSIGVEYFASRHFWIFVAILLIYNSIPQQRGSDLVSN